MIMRSRYFTKIVIHMQAVGKVLCYAVIKYRLISTYKVTILFWKTGENIPVCAQPLPPPFC